MTSLDHDSWFSWTLIVCAFATIVCHLPIFLTAVLAEQVGELLALTSLHYGLAYSSFFAAMVPSSMLFGGMIDRWGSKPFLRIALVGTGATSLGVGFFAYSWISLAAWLMLGGASAGLVQPAANSVLATSIPRGRLGSAMGLQQSAGPLASMLAGVAAPMAAQGGNWRFAYASVTVLAISGIVAMAMQGRWLTLVEPHSGSRPVRVRRNLALLMPLLVAFGLSFAGSSVVVAFYPLAASETGSTHRFIGTVLAIGSLCAIVARVVSSSILDRTTARPLMICGGMLLAGAVGLGLLSIATPISMAVGLTLSMIGTWGWTGAFWVSLMRMYPVDAGRVSAAMSPSILAGVFAPALFGVVVGSASYASAWISVSVLMLLGSCALIHVARVAP